MTQSKDQTLSRALKPVDTDSVESELADIGSLGNQWFMPSAKRIHLSSYKKPSQASAKTGKREGFDKFQPIFQAVFVTVLVRLRF